MGLIINCFLMMFSDVIETHRISSGSFEYVLGHDRSIGRECNVKTWGEIVKKVHESFRLIYKNGFQQRREPKKRHASLENIGEDRSKKDVSNGLPVDMSDPMVIEDKHVLLI